VTLPAAGAISIADVAAELGVALPLGLTDASVRTLIGKPAGAVVLPDDFWGKSHFLVGFTIGGEVDVAAGSPASGNRRVHRTLTAVVTGSGSYTYAWSVVGGSHAFSSFSGATNASTADWSQPYNTNDEPFSPISETASIQLTVTDTVAGLTLSATHDVSLG
jgi:hypothetical protein